MVWIAIFLIDQAKRVGLKKKYIEVQLKRHTYLCERLSLSDRRENDSIQIQQ